MHRSATWLLFNRSLRIQFQDQLADESPFFRAGTWSETTPAVRAKCLRNLDGQAQAKNQAAYNFCHRELRRNALVHLNAVVDAAVMSRAAAQRSLASMNGDGAPTARADDGRYQEADATRHYIFEKMDDPRTQFTVPMGIQGLGRNDILKASPGFKCIRNCN